MKASFVAQLISENAKSMYDEKSRQLWIKAMRQAGLDEATILNVYKRRFPREVIVGGARC